MICTLQSWPMYSLFVDFLLSVSASQASKRKCSAFAQILHFTFKMPFTVVQTRKTKRSRPVLTIVPSKWVSDGCVYWPPTNFVTLSANGDSEPNKDEWRKQKCKIVGRAHTYKSAEEIVRKLESVTDSEDAAQSSLGTRAHPGKKKAKFQSKTYQLAASQFKSPEVNIT